jgi:glycerophosphoryl diester phosphodiesterase
MSKKNEYSTNLIALSDQGLNPEIEINPTSEPVAAVADVDDEVFDFTNGPEILSSRHYDAFYKLRRYAMIRNDASLLPDGRVMKLSEIEKMIGRELNENLRGKCC